MKTSPAEGPFYVRTCQDGSFIVKVLHDSVGTAYIPRVLAERRAMKLSGMLAVWLKSKKGKAWLKSAVSDRRGS